jgi:hypothetical protein
VRWRSGGLEKVKSREGESREGESREGESREGEVEERIEYADMGKIWGMGFYDPP